MTPLRQISLPPHLRAWRVGQSIVVHIVRHHDPGPEEGDCIGLIGSHGHYSRAVIVKEQAPA